MRRYKKRLRVGEKCCLGDRLVLLACLPRVLRGIVLCTVQSINICFTDAWVMKAVRKDLPLSVNFHASVASVFVPVVLVHVNVLFSPHTTGSSGTLSFSISDADVFAIAVVLTGRAGLVGSSITLTFPSSALNRNSLVSLDFGGLRSLLAPVC